MQMVENFEYLCYLHFNMKFNYNKIFRKVLVEAQASFNVNIT